MTASPLVRAFAITQPRRALKGLCFAAALFGSQLGHAASITDPAGDFLATFAGSTASADLDVVSATVIYDTGNDTYSISGTMAGAIGSTANSLYVWGVNRGAGVASFAAQGITGVRFDRTVLLLANGTGSVAGTALPAGSVTVAGNTITALVSGALLPSTGFAKIDYTWNLWPRNTSFAGFAAIADFAPDNANFTVAVIPEPTPAVLMLAGLGLVAWLRRRASSR